ncbi:MAG: hypothetical protein JWQ43_2908 [Glaciihabitans sp.]|nr:hypothetical protein [Glaciihabitans sp.]
MGNNEKPLNDSPELRDAIRSIEATHEDESGLAASSDNPGGAAPAPAENGDGTDESSPAASREADPTTGAGTAS